jgi:hypothetical protein
MCGRTARTVWGYPKRFTSNSSRMPAIDRSSKRPSSNTAALLTSTSIRPHASTTSSTAASTAAPSVTSQS